MIRRNPRRKRQSTPKDEDSECQQDIKNKDGGEDGNQHDLEKMPLRHDEDGHLEREPKDTAVVLASKGHASSPSPISSELFNGDISFEWFQEALESSLDIDSFAPGASIDG